MQMTVYCRLSHSYEVSLSWLAKYSLPNSKQRSSATSRPTTTLAIFQLGETGKLWLALEVAHGTKLNKKDCSSFWMDASDMNSLYQSYVSVAWKLSFPGCDDDRADIEQVLKRCVAALSVRQRLVILSNLSICYYSNSGCISYIALRRYFLTSEGRLEPIICNVG